MFGGKTNIFSSSSKECKFLRTTKFYIIGTISTILLITLTVFSFSPIINKTESVKAAAIIADASINITSASDMVNVDITLNEKKSVFAASTADLTFNVLTNSVAGYKLAISSTDPSGELTNTEYGDKIDTITSPTNATTFANDTTTTYDNKWGIKPSKLNSTANTDYLPAPTSPTILDITSLPNTIVPNNYSIGIAARLDSTKSVGAYTDTIILVAITNPISYEFKFLDNTSDSSVTNLPPSESGSSIAIGGFIMPTKTPTRTGYTFKSWCNGTVTHIAGNDSTCSGTTYDKGAPFNDFNDPANPNNKINFYAMWAVDNYSLTLNNDDATTVGSTKARVFYNNNIIYDGDSGTSAITNPTRAYNISGFTTSGNNAAGASVSSATTLSFTYGFDGWYTPGTSPIRIITPSKTLVANTPYTNSAGKWTSTSGAELHAHWLDNGASITLPTITKSGFTCGWTTTPSGATSIEYASGQTGLRPTKDMTLYGVCTPNPYDITIRTATGIDKVSLNGVDCTSTSGCLVSGLIFGESYTLTTEVTDGYTFATWNPGSYGSVSDPTNVTTSYTVGAGNSTVTPSTTINQYNLTVDPNGGIWESSTSPQIFTQDFMSTKTITNPSNGSTYNIYYNDNSQGATFVNTPDKVERPFTSWTNTGAGSMSGNTYTFGAGNGKITANYDPTSNSFNLPTVTKTGHTCKWAKGSASGEQIVSGGSTTITEDTTFYAVCTPNPYDITIRTATGIDKVSLNGVDCTSTSGCLVSGLIFGESYTLTTEVTDGYTFVTWNPGSYGSVSDPTNVTTSYTVGAGNSTVTPSTTINQYNLTVDPNGGIWESSTSPQIFTQDFMSTKTIADPTDGPTYAISYDANDQGASYSETPNNVQKPFTSWTISGSGTGSLSGTTFTFGVGDNTLTANYGITSKPFNLPIITKTGHTCGWAKGSASGEQIVSGGSTTITEDTTFYAVCTPNPYDITIKTTLGIDKVTLNGVDCTSTTGCVVSGLIFGQSYNLVAEPTPGYTFASWDAGSYGTISDYTSERTSYTVGAGNSTITPMITVNKYILVINPNGGIWESASYPQIFEQYYKTTKTINNPSNGPIYNISYDPNGQGATYTGTPTIVERPFTNWTNSGPGTLSGTTFTFGLGNNILIANYDTASNPFNLPTITKLGHTCSWAEGSPSGPQTAGGVSTTISSDTTFYAVCTPNPYDITIKTVTGISKVTLNGVDCTSSTGCTVSGLIFDQSYNLVAEVEPGYTFASWSAGSYGSISDTTATSTSYTVGAGNSTITPSVTINKYTLTVNPNGGTWSGSTSSQTFTQNYGTTKTIADPTAGPTYSISYNANGQGASYTGSPTSVQRPFTSWTISDIGTGTLSGTTFTYGIGDNTLTANYNTTSNSFKLPAISKTGYSCKWAEGSTTGTQYAGGTSRTITASTTYYAVCSINSYTLTVNPNGGTWSGKTTPQTFTQNYGTTKTIANPSATPSYSISYNGNSQGASYTGSPTSVQRPFTSWSKSGSGTLSGTTFTFGAGNGTLTANYNTTSDSFKLPAISKTGYSCKWAEGSTSGTQYAGGTSITINGNKTYYAMCSANSYNITVKTTTGISSVTINGNTCTSSSGCTYSLKYNSSYNISASVVSGASFSSWSAGAGSFGNASASSTTYTVRGAATITPSINTSTTPIMQDFSASTCKSKETANVIDSRDNHIYSVRYITNACWMVNNISYGCNGDTKTSGSSASYCKSGDPGAWYTFSAASSVCPSGWHSPTRTEAYALAQGTGYSASILYAFNGIHYGGYYYGGSFHSASDTGYWWTDSSSYYLHFRDGNNYIDLQDDGNSNYGFYVRCVRS